jgi:hypothetical protein
MAGRAVSFVLYHHHGSPILVTSYSGIVLTHRELVCSPIPVDVACAYAYPYLCYWQLNSALMTFVTAAMPCHVISPRTPKFPSWAPVSYRRSCKLYHGPYPASSVRLRPLQQWLFIYARDAGAPQLLQGSIAARFAKSRDRSAVFFLVRDCAALGRRHHKADRDARCRWARACSRCAPERIIHGHIPIGFVGDLVERGTRQDGRLWRLQDVTRLAQRCYNHRFSNPLYLAYVLARQGLYTYMIYVGFFPIRWKK